MDTDNSGVIVGMWGVGGGGRKYEGKMVLEKYNKNELLKINYCLMLWGKNTYIILLTIDIPIN